MSRRLPLALAALTFAVLFATQATVGFVRDEGYYFEAAKSYEQWMLLLFRAPAAALQGTERYWGVNFEHPGLATLLFALSHLIFTTGLRWLPDALAWRLPGFLFGALLTYWLAVLGGQRSRAAAALAPALFWCAERTFFHGHLACFDVAICALTAGVGVAWLRGRPLWFAFMFGVALAVKHNAWVLPPVLLVHALLSRERLRLLPWILLSPLVL